jgi:tetratricopeptide (TPR) repeat protein
MPRLLRLLRRHAYAGLHNYEEAIKAFNIAIDLKPDFYRTRLNRARALVAIGQNQSAAEDYQYLLKRDPTNQELIHALDALAVTVVQRPDVQLADQTSIKTEKEGGVYVVPAMASNGKSSEGDPAAGLFLILIVLGTNFLPVIIAKVRRHNATTSIVVSLVLLDIVFLPTAMLGILALLTFPAIALAWFSVLIWSLNGNTRGKDKQRADLIAQAIRSESEAMRRSNLDVGQLGYRRSRDAG